MKISLILSCLLLFVSQLGAAEKWLTYERCSLEDDLYFDGDSFNVKALTGYTYIFRLYGVDCPETDGRIAERLEEQSDDFGVNQVELIEWGKKSRDFVKKFLSKPFTVLTLKEKAGGQSKKNRYYAVVINADGERLDEALLAAGLARAYGMGAEWPERMTRKRFITKLHSIESKAKRDKAGIWAASGQ